MRGNPLYFTAADVDLATESTIGEGKFALVLQKNTNRFVYGSVVGSMYA